MKWMIHPVFATALLTSTAAMAVNPNNGLYGGLLLGGTYSTGNNIHFSQSTLNTLNNNKKGAVFTNPGKLSYSGFGNIAGMLGYRINQFRIESELLYNSAPYKKLRIGNVTFLSPKSSSGLRMKGNTALGAVMINGFYDFWTAGSTSYFVPYVGAGIGYAKVRNQIKFYNNNNYIAGTNVSKTITSGAAQGIIGASYYLDDFTALSLDYRYITAKNPKPFQNRLQVNSLNLTFTGSITCF